MYFTMETVALILSDRINRETQSHKETRKREILSSRLTVIVCGHSVEELQCDQSLVKIKI